jgi:hypothetical protein
LEICIAARLENVEEYWTRKFQIVLMSPMVVIDLERKILESRQKLILHEIKVRQDLRETDAPVLTTKYGDWASAVRNDLKCVYVWQLFNESEESFFSGSEPVRDRMNEFETPQGFGAPINERRN